MTLDQVRAIQRIGLYTPIQALFLVNGRFESPEIFVARDTAQGNQFITQTGGGVSNRLYLLRHLHSQDTSIHPKLVACLALDGWLLEAPTPAP